MRPVKSRDGVLVVYDEKRWSLLKKKRSKAIAVMKALESAGLEPLVIGSVARGDVHEGSDIDVAILAPVPVFVIELSLEQAGFRITMKEIVQATPRHTPKAYLYLDDETSIHVPLLPLTELEQEFYRFGGALDLDGLEKGLRVCGVNKKLLFIGPVRQGHIEYSVVGREKIVAEKLGVSEDIVKERVAVLTRRSERGRTGVFLKISLPPEANVEEALMRAARRNPLLRKKIEGRLL